MAHPLFVVGAGDGSEADVYAQLMRSENDILEDRGGLRLLGDLHQQTEGQGVVNNRLSDVENGDVVAGEDGGQRGREPGAIATGDVEEKDFAHG